LAVTIITIVSGVSSREAIWFWFVALGGIIVFPAFQGPMYDSAYGLGFLQATLAQDWMTPSDRAYYQELLRFRSTQGTSGHPRGDRAWATAYCVLFPANILSGVLIVLAFYPQMGSPLGVAMTIAEWVAGLVAGIAYSRRTIRLFTEAKAKGFRLLELKEGTRRPWLTLPD
jgi:hypothetical protein